MPSTKSTATPEPVSTDQVVPSTARRRGPSLNRVTLICRLTGDPELRYPSSGTAAASLRVVVNDREEPDFLDVTAWRELAELAAKYLVKGWPADTGQPEPRRQCPGTRCPRTDTVFSGPPEDHRVT
jgi:hypothetical protein